MALPLSGAISASAINIELGKSATALITLNDTAARTLAGVSGSGTTISMSNFYGKSNAPSGSFTAQTPGTGSWTVPTGVTSICVLVIGAGGATWNLTKGDLAGSGGGLAYVNNLSVSPGTTWYYQVGSGNNADAGLDENSGFGDSSPLSLSTPNLLAAAGGGAWPTQEVNRNGYLGGDAYFNGSFIMQAFGYKGGDSGPAAGVGSTYYLSDCGGGGAGGFQGAGGRGGYAVKAEGGAYISTYSATSGVGTYGGGGGGGWGGPSGGAGGGSWVYQANPSGAAGANGDYNVAGGGGGGLYFNAVGANPSGGYGGGAGSSDSTQINGADGLVYIMWGSGKSFPFNIT